MAASKGWARNDGLRDDLKAASIELIGTTVFLLLALGGIQSAKISVAAIQGLQVAQSGPHSIDHNIYISTCVGISLFASAWMFYRTTGAVFNPAISLALLLIRQISIMRFILYFIAQLIGGIFASALVLWVTPGPVLFNTTLGGQTSLAQGVFVEFFCTAILVLSVLMLAAEKSRITPFAPVGISMALFAGHMFSVTLTGASLNPARSFGPSVVARSFGKDHWVYWVGPLGGSLLSVIFYAWLKHTKYWHITPHAIDTRPEKSPEDPIKAVRRDLEKGKSQEDREEDARRENGTEKV